jgi:hypothetical protein
MAARDEIEQGLLAIGPLLDAPELEPDPRKGDWPQQGPLVASLRDRLDRGVLRLVEAALAEATDEADRQELRQDVANLLAEVAAVVYASGDVAAGSQLLSRARDLVGQGAQRAYWEASARDPSVFVQFARARWRQRRGDLRTAEKLLKQIQRTARDPVLKDAARSLLTTSKPLTSAPSLGTVNGVGLRVYGSRDERPDGSYVTTRYVTFVYVPVLPLGAYRVVRQGDGWIFLGREPLGALALLWQRLVLAGAALGLVYLGITSYLHSHVRQVKLALERAAVQEKAGHAEEALRAYEDTIHEYQGKVSWDQLSGATDAMVRVSLAGVAKPMVLAQVDALMAAVERVERLPKPARSKAAAATLVAKLGACAAELGDATTETAQASLNLLHLALRLAESGKDDIVVRQAQIRVGQAARVANTYPLWALEQYSEATQDPRALAVARAELEDLAGAPSLLLESKATVEGWLAALASRPEDADLARQVRASLDRALAWGTDPTRTKALEEQDRAGLERIAVQQPQDQEVAVGVASLLRDAGEGAQARARLASLGTEGRIIGAGQQLLAGIYLEEGKLEDAERLLGAHVAMRLPMYQKALGELSSAATAFDERLNRQAETGQLPNSITLKLFAAPEEEKPAIFQAWADEEFAKDASLVSLRDAATQRAAVVSAVLSLGTVKLQRAGQATGDAKQKLLEEAARTYRSIAEAAQGQTAYHLGLGRIYYRLGRTAEGEEELAKLTSRQDPQLTLEVARVYRELGLQGRAKDLAEQVHRGSDRAASHQAATLRYLLASSLEEQEEWLERADPGDRFVKTALLEIQGQRLLREGKLPEADDRFAQVAELYRSQGARESSGLNNAALALQRRFQCTGDRAHLAEASKLLETAFRQNSNALIAGNLAELYQYQATLRVLDQFVDTRPLLLTDGQATQLLQLFRAGTERAKVAEVLRQIPAFRKSLELYRQEEILGPQRASPYEGQLLLHGWIDDIPAMEQLLARINALASLDTSRHEENRRKWLDGSLDAVMKTALESDLARLEGQIQNLSNEGASPATQGAAWYLKGAALSRRAAMDGNVADLEAAISAFRQSEALGKWSGISPVIGWTLVTLAVLQAREASPPLAALWKSEHRKHSTPEFLFALLEMPDTSALLGAIRRAPAWREGIALVEAGVGNRPVISEWMLARVAGDAKLEKATVVAFQRPQVILIARIDAKLEAWNPSSQKNLELLAQHGH